MSFFKSLSKSKPQKSGIVFIVEDNKTYAETLKSFLRVQFTDLKEVAIFPVGETCLPELGKNPDFIIIDYFLDSKFTDAETGLEIIKEIRDQNNDVKIIVLSSQDDFTVVVKAIRKYNCTYVKKDEEAFEKVAAIINEVK